MVCQNMYKAAGQKVQSRLHELMLVVDPTMVRRVGVSCSQYTYLEPRIASDYVGHTCGRFSMPRDLK